MLKLKLKNESRTLLLGSAIGNTIKNLDLENSYCKIHSSSFVNLDEFNIYDDLLHFIVVKILDQYQVSLHDQLLMI